MFIGCEDVESDEGTITYYHGNSLSQRWNITLNSDESNQTCIFYEESTNSTITTTYEILNSGVYLFKTTDSTKQAISEIGDYNYGSVLLGNIITIPSFRYKSNIIATKKSACVDSSIDTNHNFVYLEGITKDENQTYDSLPFAGYWETYASNIIKHSYLLDKTAQEEEIIYNPFALCNDGHIQDTNVIDINNTDTSAYFSSNGVYSWGYTRAVEKSSKFLMPVEENMNSLSKPNNDYTGYVTINEYNSTTPEHYFVHSKYNDGNITFNNIDLTSDKVLSEFLDFSINIPSNDTLIKGIYPSVLTQNTNTENIYCTFKIDLFDSKDVIICSGVYPNSQNKKMFTTFLIEK